jgi:cell division protein FtsB
VRRSTWVLLASAVALVGLLFLFVFPTSTWLNQRRDRREVEAQLSRLTRQNRELEERVRRLHTDAEIERLAREYYNLVRPGDQAFAILPARPVPRAPAAARSAPTHQRQGLWVRVWDRLF